MAEPARQVNDEQPSQQAMAKYEEQPLSVEAIKAQNSKVMEVVKSVMKQGQDFGTLPGTNRPTLLKPGAEKLLLTFRIANTPVATDLSTSDRIRYRVECRGTSMITGAYLGSGIGECSSDEEKYKWRKSICDAEWNETPADQRREKWARGKNGNYKIKQVRSNPFDLANTILKMAKKRAQVDLVLSVTAASDTFTQDVEDLPKEYLDHGEEERSSKNRERAKPAQDPAPTQDSIFVSEAQIKRMFAIAGEAGVSKEKIKDFLFSMYGIDSSKKIKKIDYDGIIDWIKGGV